MVRTLFFTAGFLCITVSAKAITLIELLVVFAYIGIDTQFPCQSSLYKYICPSTQTVSVSFVTTMALSSTNDELDCSIISFNNAVGLFQIGQIQIVGEFTNLGSQAQMVQPPQTVGGITYYYYQVQVPTTYFAAPNLNYAIVFSSNGNDLASNIPLGNVSLFRLNTSTVSYVCNRNRCISCNNFLQGSPVLWNGLSWGVPAHRQAITQITNHIYGFSYTEQQLEALVNTHCAPQPTTGGYISATKNGCICRCYDAQTGLYPQNYCFGSGTSGGLDPCADLYGPDPVQGAITSPGCVCGDGNDNTCPGCTVIPY